MTDQQKHAVYFLAGLVGIALLLRWWTNRPAPVVEEPPANDFYAPYSWPAGGWFPGPNMNGGNVPFESVVNVYVDNPALAGIANQYIPMFGLVGMTAVGM